LDSVMVRLPGTGVDMLPDRRRRFARGRTAGAAKARTEEVSKVRRGHAGRGRRAAHTLEPADQVGRARTMRRYSHWLPSPALAMST